MESILQIQEKYRVDDSIKSYEYNEYHPTSGSNLNMAGQITIRIDNEDEFYHPRRSWLLVQGDLVKADDSLYAVDDLVTLTNNGICTCFQMLIYNKCVPTNVTDVAAVKPKITANFVSIFISSLWYVSCSLFRRVG